MELNPFNKKPIQKISYTERKRREREKSKNIERAALGAVGAAGIAWAGATGEMLAHEAERSGEIQNELAKADRAEIFNETGNPLYEDESVRVERTYDIAHPPTIHIKHHTRREVSKPSKIEQIPIPSVSEDTSATGTLDESEPQ